MIAVSDNHELDRTAGFAREALGVLPRYYAVQLPGLYVQRAGVLSGPPRETQCGGHRPGVLLRRAMRARAKGFAREFRQALPRGETVRPRAHCATQEDARTVATTLSLAG